MREIESGRTGNLLLLTERVVREVILSSSLGKLVNLFCLRASDSE